MIVVQHARDRALQYHGLAPTEEEWSEAIEQIRQKKGLLVRKDTYDRNCEVWSVKLAGKSVFVVYSPKRNIIITVLSNGLSLPRAKNRT